MGADTYLNTLSTASTTTAATKPAQFAFWINAWNAVTVKGIRREYATTSIRNHTAKLVRQHISGFWNEPQLGYGAACLRGMDAIQERIRAGETPPSVVLFLDADYRDHPDYLTSLVAPIFSGTADFVLGSRLLGQREPGAMPWQRIFGNKLACFLMYCLFRIRHTDLGPFRAIRYDSLCDLQMSDRNFGWTI